MKKNIRILAAVLCMVMTLSCGVTAFAAAPSVTETDTITTAGGTGDAQLQLTVVYPSGTIHGDTFSAVVPAVIPISGEVGSSDAVCPTNAKIINNNVERAIRVTDIQMTSGTWTVVDYDNGNFETGKNVSMSFNGCKADQSGNVALTGNWVVAADGELPLSLTAKISKQSKPVSTTQIATVSFTLGWA